MNNNTGTIISPAAIIIHEDWHKVSEPELKRHKCLDRLGLTENDIQIASHLFALQQVGAALPDDKVSRLTGYSPLQIARSKGLRVLGMSEEDLEKSISIELSRLGYTFQKEPSTWQRFLSHFKRRNIHD